ncbi:hypothetical protein DOJK_00141 [Patescibacteria group bacterium]|nr:hypothetical protein DOJK_00141 [Patescibacteria group bacterium]
MRNIFRILTSAVLILFSVSALAGAVLTKEQIPEKVLAGFNKKHPNAIEITAEPKKHFGQDLFLITYKAGKAEDPTQVVYFRANGNLFVNGNDVATGQNAVRMPAVAYDNLKTAFGEYTINSGISIINPNGIGEEFDLIISASGKTWRVSLDRDGKIVDKTE